MSKAILLTGGLGDVITIESFLSDQEKKEIEVIFYATRAQYLVKDIIGGLPSLPSLKHHTILWDDYEHQFAFHSKSELLNNLLKKSNSDQEKNKIKELLGSIADYSISVVFNQISKGRRPYVGSSLLMYKMADISAINLPNKVNYNIADKHKSFLEEMEKRLRKPKFYVCICPYTNDKRISERDFNEIDWLQTIKLLKDMDVTGVVLNHGDELIPDHPNLINLNKKTTIRESIEILKGAKGYFGIDSALSVLAAKLFDPPWLIIKSVNQHLFNHAKIYYAPKTNFSFIRGSI
jgi:ADP-heptose:LPS heptosyltransferase